MNDNLKRYIRIALKLCILLLCTYLICDYIAGDHYDKVDNSETFTTYCIKLRPQYVDQSRITDLNCSLENNQKRVYITLSDEAIEKSKKDFPFKSVGISCTPFSITNFIAARNIEKPEQIIDSYIEKHNLKALCQQKNNFKASNLTLEYMNANNAPQFLINFLL